MRISILGASGFGIATVKKLIADGHEVVLIDKDRTRLDDLSQELDCGLICGDGTLPSILREAFGDGSDALVALTNEDDVNILASVVATSIGYGRVIPQIVRPELLTVVEELGLDETVTPHESVAEAIVSALEQHSELAAAITLRNELRMISVHVPEAIEAATIAALELPADARVIAHVREGAETLADPETSISPGDCLLIVVKRERLQAVQKLFAPAGGA